MARLTIQEAFDLASQHHQAGRFQEAEVLYRQILSQQPDHANTIQRLGALAGQLGHYKVAADLLQRVLRLQPDHVEAYRSLGNILFALGRFDEAAAYSRHALQLKPDYVEVYNELGVTLLYLEKIDEAVAAYREAVRLKPDFALAYSNLGNALGDLGQLDEAIDCYRKAIEIEPNYADAESNLVLTLNYHPDLDAESVLAEHRAWAARHANHLSGEPVLHSNDRAPDRRLRVGYVSGDFRRHPVGHFFAPLLNHHDRGNFEVFCYSNAERGDDLTKAMKGFSDGWRDIFKLDDDAVDKQIRADDIDILVDLSGHSAGGRLRVFGRKPAPIQVTYLGYPNTTGMTAVDYRLTDALADPPGMTDVLNAEKLWRLPVCAWCYQPGADAPAILPRGDRPIIFGCFNSYRKINGKLIAMWATLLGRVPESRLLIKSAGAAQASSRQRLKDQFAEHGIADDRIELQGLITDTREHLERYAQVDVALDTYPYHGTTTTCEALLMGVAVITLAGRTHVSRVGVSLLTNVGLPELIAQSPEEYISLAAHLANDPSRLKALRFGLRNKVISSPLVDGNRFARDVERAYRQMWREWCGR